MKDLDIRGAGDLLGAEQSGFINDIGFETYHKILEEAVRELKSEHFAELFEDRQLARGGTRDQSDDCIIETDLTMLIPNSYVSETAERLALYRKLDDIKDETELQKFTTEVTDRFGPIPQQVVELMEAIRLRWLGQHMGLEKMVLKKARSSAPSSPTRSTASLRATPSTRYYAQCRRSLGSSRCTKRVGRLG
ncbi:MAG: hypothetical protein IPO12_06145 [Flavobacteriales bacterium]|nr:hypothetical protein [Flavobacteriales bacterium]